MNGKNGTLKMPLPKPNQKQKSPKKV